MRAPAKINPFLAVRGRRDDGYHELVTVFQTVAVQDVVTAELEGEGGRFHHPAGRRRTVLSLAHDAGPTVPSGPDNLVLRAAALLAGEAGIALMEPASLDDARERRRPVPTRIDLRKRIPIAGGMGGGSVDAAAALVALNELWEVQLSRGALRDLSAELGADVPFCVVGGTAIATGTGTGVTRVLCRGHFDWVVCTASEELSTAAVYRSWDADRSPSEVEPDAVLAAMSSGDAEALGAALHNDLQPAAETLLPRLVADRKALLDAGALGAMVSGSGPTLVALADGPDEAQRIAARVAGRFRQVLTTTSPAGGPVLDRC